jgi:hypothetical protein
MANQVAWQDGHHAIPGNRGSLRIEHPEAEKVAGTLVLSQVPGTEEARDQLQYRR